MCSYYMHVYKSRSERIVGIDVATFSNLSQLGGNRTGKSDLHHHTTTYSRITTQKIEIHQFLLISMKLKIKRHLVLFIASATSSR